MNVFLLAPVLVFTGCGPENTIPEFAEPESLPAIQARASTNTPAFGEPVDVDIRITAEERLALPPVADWLSGPVELLRDPVRKTRDETEAWRHDISLQVAVYAATNLTLFAESSIRTETDPPASLELPFLSLEVQSLLEGEPDPSPKFGSDVLPDFRGPEARRRRVRNLWIGAAMAAAVLALLAFWAWRRANRPRPAPPPTPPHRIALRAMERLQSDPDWTEPDVDACAVRLSAILRTYIEHRFGIRAPDLTTEEFLREVEREAPWGESEQAGLARFFEATDRIKFAADRPGRPVLEDLMNAARQFVDATTPREASA